MSTTDFLGQTAPSFWGHSMCFDVCETWDDAYARARSFILFFHFRSSHQLIEFQVQLVTFCCTSRIHRGLHRWWFQKIYSSCGWSFGYNGQGVIFESYYWVELYGRCRMLGQTQIWRETWFLLDSLIRKASTFVGGKYKVTK